MTETSEPIVPELEPVGHGLKIENKLHSVREVADIFQVDPQTVRIWLRMNYLTGIKVGNSWRVSREAMEQYAIGKYS
jgi:excisionase family DNA binding protein